jgi:DNA/RNA non-specific endonuclease
VASASLAERKSPRAVSPTPRPIASPSPAATGATAATGLAAGVPGIGNRQAGPGGPAGTAGPRVTLGAAPPGPEVSLKGKSTFEPPPSVADYLKTHPRGGGEVVVRFPGLAAGVIRVQEHRGKYSTPDELQAIDIQHPALEPLRSVGLSPLLAVQIANNAITGYVTVSTGRRPLAGRGEIVSQIRRHSAALGMLGMGDLRTPTFENKLDGGALSLKTDLAFTLGAFLRGTGSLGLSDDVVTFTAHASASVGKIANPALDLTRRPDGVIEGRAEIPIALKNFSGNFVITFAGGIVDASGTFRYTTEKFSGEVTLLITDAQTARNVAYQHLPPEAIDASARNAAGGSAVAAAPSSSGPKPGPRAVAGWGTLDVHYNDWLSGKALVVVDSQGHVTVVGKITPPAKVEFPQTKLDYEHQIFAFEVRASYGVPVVGNVFLFAGVGLFALAKISPLTLSKIEIVGTYSTDPAIFNSFSLSANLNISALAGIRLRAEGGVGIEIADHDIKIGAALTATAGIRAYVDATPLIGYRELADPTVGRRGEFYIHGEAEIAAQPFLALGGELFVKLVTPWWSPVSDHTWTWPLGELTYPLPGEIGVGADVDYIFGSGKLPTISPKKVDFNADRFMSDLMDDNVPHGSAAEVKKPGRWNERLQAPPAPPAPPQIKDTKGPGKRKDDKPVKESGKTWAAGMKAVGQLKQRGETHPYGAAEIDAALKTIKSQHGFSILQAKPVGDNWEIAATLGKDSLKKPLRIKRTSGGGSPGPFIFEVREGGHTLRVLPDLSVVQFSTPVPVTGAHAQKIEQAALESIVTRQQPSYPIDSLSRASGSSGHVRGVKDGEDRASISQIGLYGYQPGDHRGHLIGDRFYGPGSDGNLVPMHPTLNLSTFKSYENRLASAYRNLVTARKAALLHMRVVPHYPSNDPTTPASRRPTSVSGFSKVITLRPGSTTLSAIETPIDSGPLSNPSASVTTFNINAVAKDVTFLRSLRLDQRLIDAIGRDRDDGRFRSLESMWLRLSPRLGVYAPYISQLDRYRDRMTF